MSTNTVMNLPEQSQIFRDIKGLVGNDDRIKKIVIESLQKGHTPDSLGIYFEKTIKEKERKNHGQYYTPRLIVKYILSQLDIQEDSTILDPSCGCGSFLLTAYDLLGKKYGRACIKNLYGVDNNSGAAKITQACLYMKVNHDKRYSGIILQNIKIGNSLVNNKSIDSFAFDWKKEYPRILESGGFDFIVGNPPYVTLQKYSGFDPTESIYSKIIDGPTNAATLMIGKSVDLLNQGGVLAFLLPRSILYVDSYKKLRSYLIQNMQILQIVDLGATFRDVRGEQIVLIVKKLKPEKTSKIRIVDFPVNINLFEPASISVSQVHLQSTNQFPTFNCYHYHTLVEKLSSIGKPLELAVNGKIFRGISIGGNRLHSDCIDSVEAIRGKNIAKFKIRNIMQLERTVLADQSRIKTKNLQTKKVILQNIFSSESGIIAAYDAKGIITLDTVTNICVSDDIQGKYLLALLNSKLINFYLIYGVFNLSKLTMHLDKSYIGRIPIIENHDNRKQKNIIEIVESILNCDDKTDLKPRIREIDKVVYELYSLKENEVELIEQAIEKSLSRKSIW